MVRFGTHVPTLEILPVIESRRYNHNTMPAPAVSIVIAMLILTVLLFACLGLEALL